MPWRFRKGQSTYEKRRKGEPRPRLCRVCHEPATCVVITTVPQTFIKRDGRVIRSTGQECVFYCDDHG